MNSQIENEVNNSQLSPPWEDAQTTDPITFDRLPKYKPKQNHFTRLLLPQEREDENPPEEKPKSTKRSHKRRPQKVLHEIEFAHSIADSVNSLDHSLLLNELEQNVFEMHNDWREDNSEDLFFRAKKTCLEKCHTISHTTQPNTTNKTVAMDSSITSVSEKEIDSILSGEIPLPLSCEDEDDFRELQSRLDKRIVDILPSEFWGSRFYMPSTSFLDIPSPSLSPMVAVTHNDRQLLKALTDIANHKEPRIMQVVHTRFSRKRTKHYLSDLATSFSSLVEPKVMKKAMKRMKKIAENLYTLPIDRKQKVL